MNRNPVAPPSARRAPFAGWLLLLLSLCGALAAAPAGARLLIPMDLKQGEHLKAYGLAYWVLTTGDRVEWLLNYRGGSFLLNETSAIMREANIRGVTFESIGDGAVADIYKEIESSNMEDVVLEKAPKVAVYIPPGFVPWDDAVTLVLTYADIPFTQIWDEEVLNGELEKYDWLHLHHEDFTGQYGKFYANFRNADWYRQQQARYEEMAHKLGYKKVGEEKKAVARAIKEYVAKGGFLFAMCSATDSFDIALAAEGTDICDTIYDGDPADPAAQSKLNFDKCLAFTDFTLQMNPLVYEFSNIDTTNPAQARGPDADFFTLFDFSAGRPGADHADEPRQRHQRFMGQTTGYKNLIKKGVIIMGGPGRTRSEVSTATTARALTLAARPDYQQVGDPPTDLSLHPNSPGYRLILNNILFPAPRRSTGARPPRDSGRPLGLTLRWRGHPHGPGDSSRSTSSSTGPSGRPTAARSSWLGATPTTPRTSPSRTRCSWMSAAASPASRPPCTSSRSAGTAAASWAGAGLACTTTNWPPAARANCCSRIPSTPASSSRSATTRM
jgi:hypothetical protein